MILFKKNSCLSATDWHCNWVNTFKKQAYPNGCRKRKLPRFRRMLQRNKRTHDVQYILSTSSKKLKWEGKCKLDIVWLQKDLWYDTAEEENSVTENLKDIRQDHNLLEYNEKQGSGFVSKKSNDSKGKMLFVIAMITISHLLRKVTRGYKFLNTLKKLNYFMYIDGMNIFAKTEKELKVGDSDRNKKNTTARV